MPADLAEQTILALLRAQQTITPEAVARALAQAAPAGALAEGALLEGAWRRFLHPVRLAAMRLAAQDKIEFLRKGKPVAPEQARGVLRLRLKSGE